MEQGNNRLLLLGQGGEQQTHAPEGPCSLLPRGEPECARGGSKGEETDFCGSREGAAGAGGDGQGPSSSQGSYSRETAVGERGAACRQREACRQLLADGVAETGPRGASCQAGGPCQRAAPGLRSVRTSRQRCVILPV